MPRQARIKGSHRTYHIVMRGKENCKIFKSDPDKEAMLEILKKAIFKHDLKFEAFCLMDNHIHLIIGCNGNNISNIMKSISIGYVTYFNSAHNRSGPLMHDRYMSETLPDIRHLLLTSAHIHINPVTAGYAETPESYPWSSCGVYTAKLHEESMVDCSRILGHFSADRAEAVEGYKSYLEKFEYPGDVLDTKEDKIECMKNRKDYIDSYESAWKYVVSELDNNSVTIKELPANKDLRRKVILHLRQNSIMTLKEIGQLVGGLSHSTVNKVLFEMQFIPSNRLIPPSVRLSRPGPRYHA